MATLLLCLMFATCRLLKSLAREVSDGVIAPGYTEEALAVLKGKRKGTYNIIKIDENYKPELSSTSRYSVLPSSRSATKLKLPLTCCKTVRL